jgi:hypothetical protein
MSMAGVAGPLLRQSRASGLRFLSGLTLGGAAGGLVLAVPVYVIGSTLGSVVPRPARLVVLLVLCTALAVADLRQRTPHVWRQVPQSLARTLPPGSRGLAWGFDLGLLFTTMKSTSLIWASMAALLLLRPSLAAVALVAITVVVSLTSAAASLGGAENRISTQWGARWLTPVRRASGTLLLTLVLATAGPALLA